MWVIVSIRHLIKIFGKNDQRFFDKFLIDQFSYNKIMHAKKRQTWIIILGLILPERRKLLVTAIWTETTPFT